MGQWKKNIAEAIGNTPLVRLTRVVGDVPGELYAKCEYMNPGGSIKDRIGWHMVAVAEQKGLLQPGGTIIEATSGNTGVGLAIAAVVKGYRAVFVMPDKMSEEKRAGLRAFGAEVVITPAGVAPDHPDSHYKTAARLAKEIPNSFFVNQYENLANSETHYLTTGPELYAQTDNGDFDAFVAGMGTCGTISGIGRYFKEKKPSVKMVGVDPKGSILKKLFETGQWSDAVPWKIEGIGEDIKPANCDFSVVDEIVEVEDTESYLMARDLLTKEGIFVGSSCGAAVVGALRWMRKQPKPTRAVVLLVDGGSRYLSKLFNDAWMIENGFFQRSEQTTVGTFARVLKRPAPAPVVAPSATWAVAAEAVRQAPNAGYVVVADGENFVGVVDEKECLQRAGSNEPLGPKVARDVAFVREGQTVADLRKAVASGAVAIVREGMKAKYALGRADVDAFFGK